MICKYNITANTIGEVEISQKRVVIKGGIVMRINITLACTESGDRNYITTKNKRNNPERIEMKKYCPRLKRITLHRETK